MIHATTIIIATACMLAAPFVGGDTQMRDPNRKLERTTFQTGGPWNPKIDIKADVAMVYGINANVGDRIKQWRDHGYIVQVMTGVAWGEYQDYFDGRWDGKNHDDESQTDRNGHIIGHGPTVPYVAPSITYGKYLCVGVQRALDAGAEAIYLEEPEFWVNAGYSPSFKREWQSYYNEPWIAPHSTPDAQYRASKLKYFLYRRALQQIFDYIQDYNKRTGKSIRCYVPTHSMINYSHWRIVSPEQSLVQLKGCDGYIGQVWTGTARTPNVYNGRAAERTFETAFFEYGVLHNLVRSTGRRMYYLNDPVEDDPNHSWIDYRRNWECTLTASLLWPDVWNYEVAPWPERPFMFKYPENDQPGAKRVSISPEYATELMTVFSALNDMNQKKVSWDCGTQAMGVLVSDTMMFQRGDPNPSDGHLGSFYGLALPLLKTGAPVQPVQMENIGIKDYLKPFKVLFLTYEGQKPPAPELHAQLAEWVKAGGVLVFVDDGKDPYNSVTEWWNSKGLHYASPSVHLFEQLGVGNEEGVHPVGRGAVIVAHKSPAKLTYDPNGANTAVNLAKQACAKAKLDWRETNYLVLRRGPYVVAAGLDEVAGEPFTLAGKFIDLFDHKLAVHEGVTLEPGTRKLLVDLAKLNRKAPCVVASASKITGEKSTESSLTFFSEGPAETVAATRIRLPRKPKSIKVGSLEASQIQSEWDAGSKTLLLEFPNSTSGMDAIIQF